MKLRRTDKNNEVIVFDNNSEMLKVMRSLPYINRGKEFLGEELRSHDEVDRRFNRDWAAALYDVEQCRKKICEVELPQLRSKKRKRTYSSEDGDIDMERLMAGSDNYRETTRRQVKDGSTEVTIVVDVSAPYFEKSEDVFWRGAAGLVIAEKLSDAGYSVEMWNIASTGNTFVGIHNRTSYAAKLKECSDPFDISSLCNAMGGWYFRSAIIHCIDALGVMLKREVSPGHGYVCMASPDMINILTNDQDCFYIAGIKSFDGALAVVLSTLEKMKAIQNHTDE